MSIAPWNFPRAELLPTYAFVASDAVKAKVRAQGADLIDLGLGNPDQATPASIVSRLQEAAEIGKNHRYHPGRGFADLRLAHCEWYKRRYGVDFDPDRHVMVTMGAKDGMTGLCLAILGQGDHVLSPDPAYPIHAGAPLIAGAEVHTYPVEAPDQAAVIGQRLRELAASGRRVKLVILNYPHNPTGRIVSAQELKAIVEVVRDSGALLLHDMAYADLDFQNRNSPSVFDCGLPFAEVERFAVEAFSLSKSYHMPGWRIAFMVGSPAMIAALAHLKTYTDYGTFAPLQVAAAWALRNGDAIVDEIREMYRSRARALVQGLRRAGWTEAQEPTGTMFVWTRLPRALAHLDSFSATAYLIENAHVAVSPGSGFGPAGEGFVRFALIEDPPRIQEACDRIGRVLARLEEKARPSAAPAAP
ncbi:MAG TPA: aminotransferase class I/II-fold pyridoxal phosphate-dependent enzyme [Polyangiaceae bacterium]|nr:aminotransferase class I/II-fold pyridoxal phosphate-dependent enzyme [Polyangiaceae bacterium]